MLCPLRLTNAADQYARREAAFASVVFRGQALTERRRPVSFLKERELP